MSAATTTKERFAQAAEIHVRRERGETWADVTKAVDVSESTGRKMLKELEGAERRDEYIADARAELAEPVAVTAPTGARSGRYRKLTCGCSTPNVIRTSKAVMVKGVVKCGDCDELFAEREAA